MGSSMSLVKNANLPGSLQVGLRSLCSGLFFFLHCVFGFVLCLLRWGMRLRDAPAPRHVASYPITVLSFNLISPSF